MRQARTAGFVSTSLADACWLTTHWIIYLKRDCRVLELELTAWDVSLGSQPWGRNGLRFSLKLGPLRLLTKNKWIRRKVVDSLYIVVTPVGSVQKGCGPYTVVNLSTWSTFLEHLHCHYLTRLLLVTKTIICSCTAISMFGLYYPCLACGVQMGPPNIVTAPCMKMEV